MKQFDCVVIGAGAAGLTAAKAAQGLGKTVALIERNEIGGDCTLTGCVPSKTLIKSSQIANYMRNPQPFGLQGTCEPKTQGVMAHVRSVIQDIAATHTAEKLREQGISVIFGAARFIEGDRLAVDEERIKAHRYIIATGSEPSVPPINGLDSTQYLTNKNLFDLNEIPRSLIIIGGGPIGVEMACAFNHLGCAVTIIEQNDRLVSKEDAEVAEHLLKYMREQGITIKTGASAQQVAQAGEQVTVTIAVNGDNEHLVAEKLLIAVGQRPVVRGLGLDAAGVSYSNTGIEVNDYMRTTVSSIYACGDVVGPYQFSHVAYYQARVAVRNAFIPVFKEKIDYTHICWVLYTDPELARAGMTESQAREIYGDRLRVYHESYGTIDRAHTEGDTRGFAKIICAPDGTILGAHVLGSHAGEVMQELQLGKFNDISFADFFKPLHAYPAYTDLIWHASKDAYVDRIQRNPFVRLYKRIMG